VIGLYEAGVTNAVASLGTALTQQQARLLKRFVNTVYIAYDGDAAGQNATIRGLDILTAEGLSVRVIVFPNEQDPDEFVRQNGKEAFDRLKENALSLNAFKLEAMARSYALEREDERERYATEACRFIATLSPVERERYYQQLSFKTGYSLETLKAQGATTRPPEPFSSAEVRRDPPRKAQTRAAPREDERSRAESALLFHMLQSREAAALVLKESLESRFTDEGFQTFALGLLQAYERKEEPNVPLLIASMDKASAERVSAALREEAACEDPAKAAKDCLCRIEQCDLAQRIEEIKRKLGEPAIQPAQRAEYLREMQMLNLQMRGLR
jgi:DNA primase